MNAKFGFAGLIGVGCVVAAAAGGYVALRSNATDMQPAPVAAPAVPVTTPAPSDTPVAIPEATRSEAPVTPSTVTAKAPTSTQAATRTITKAPSAPAASTPTASGNTASNTDVQTPASNAAAPATNANAAPAAPTAPQAPATPPVSPTRYDEVTVAADSVLGVRLDSTISTETAHLEDRVNARLSRDVIVDGRVAIPAGARLEGVVTAVERGGKFKERPRLGIAFNTLVLADGTRTAIQTTTIYRDGDSPAANANTKVGGSAVVGAILGAMIGGKKGALIGSTAGAAGGAAAVAAGDRAEAVMTSGTQVTARLSAPVTVLIERDNK